MYISISISCPFLSVAGSFWNSWDTLKHTPRAGLKRSAEFKACCSSEPPQTYLHRATRCGQRAVNWLVVSISKNSVIPVWDEHSTNTHQKTRDVHGCSPSMCLRSSFRTSFSSFSTIFQCQKMEVFWPCLIETKTARTRKPMSEMLGRTFSSGISQATMFESRRVTTHHSWLASSFVRS